MEVLPGRADALALGLDHGGGALPGDPAGAAALLALRLHLGPDERERRVDRRGLRRRRPPAAARAARTGIHGADLLPADPHRRGAGPSRRSRTRLRRGGGAGRLSHHAGLERSVERPRWRHARLPSLEKTLMDPWLLLAICGVATYLWRGPAVLIAAGVDPK